MEEENAVYNTQQFIEQCISIISNLDICLRDKLFNKFSEKFVHEKQLEKERYSFKVIIYTCIILA